MSKTTITDLLARRVWDSRGRPTIEVEITTAGGTMGRAMGLQRNQSELWLPQ